MFRIGLVLAVFGLALLAAPTGVDAQDARGETAAEGEGLDAPRPVPDYDGLPEPSTDVDDVLLWIPRIVFFPVYVVSEYVLRRPLVTLIALAEKHQVIDRIIDFFTWNDGKAGILPTAIYDFGLIPSVGFYLFWNDLGVPNNDFRLHVAFGGTDLVRVSTSDTIEVDTRTEVSVRAEAQRRPDHVFQGLGWGTFAVDRSRFIWTRFEGGLRFERGGWQKSFLRLDSRISGNSFDANGYGLTSDDPSLQASIDNGHIVEPPGLDGFVAYRQRLTFMFDTRPRDQPSSTGLRLGSYGELAFDVTRLPERRWLKYGGLAQAFFEVADERVLSVGVAAELSHPLGSDDVPFTEMPALSGRSLGIFPGILTRQLVGHTLFLFNIEYVYPIWVDFDAGLHLSVGNVFGPDFIDFSIDRNRASFGFSIQNLGTPDHSFHLALAFGTAPFITGAAIDSVRFLIGGESTLLD